MSLLVIVNTRSGSLRSAKRQAALRTALIESKVDATVVEPASYHEVATTVRVHLDRGYETVVAAGGDGTVNAVAAQLAGTGARLGVIAGGTLNHFARDLKIPLDMAGAVQLLKTGATRRVDVASVNGRPFLNNSGLGLYPDAVLRRREIRKRGFRKTTAMLLAAAITLVRLPLLRLRLDVNGRTLDRLTPFIFVGNNPYELSGDNPGTRTRLDSGELWLLVARDRSRMGLLKSALRLRADGLGGSANFDAFRTREAWIETRARTVPVSLDGEVVRLETPLRYEIRQGALAVIVPSGGEPG